jgi:hypothetical protein
VARGGERTGLKRAGSSRYVGVTREERRSSWKVSVTDPQTKRSRYVGCFASEEDAARAYDCAAVQAHGPGAKRNFPDVAISELPATVGGERKQRTSSRYLGVSWHKATSSWAVSLTDPQTKRRQSVGYFASEEDAARAYDCAAVQAHGPASKRNFPAEAISKPPVTKGDERKQCNSSRYLGVSWHKATSSWAVSLTDPQTKRRQSVGYFASEEDAARAYDCAAVQVNGPASKRNFPGEAISEPPVSLGEQRKQRSSSRFIGVMWHKASSSFRVELYDSQTKSKRHIGCYTSEEDAARAYDHAVVEAHGPDAKRNFPGEVISEPPVTVGEEQKQRRAYTLQSGG